MFVWDAYMLGQQDYNHNQPVNPFPKGYRPHDDWDDGYYVAMRAHIKRRLNKMIGFEDICAIIEGKR